MTGWGACNRSFFLCTDGIGDCDSEQDCVGDLICLQRHVGETYVGYDFSQIAPDVDVCVKPGYNKQIPHIDPVFLLFVFFLSANLKVF